MSSLARVGRSVAEIQRRSNGRLSAGLRPLRAFKAARCGRELNDHSPLLQAPLGVIGELLNILGNLNLQSEFSLQRRARYLVRFGEGS